MWCLVVLRAGIGYFVVSINKFRFGWSLEKYRVTLEVTLGLINSTGPLCSEILRSYFPFRHFVYDSILFLSIESLYQEYIRVKE